MGGGVKSYFRNSYNSSHNFFSSEEGKIKTRYYYFHKKAKKKFQVTLKGTGPLSKIHCIRNILTNKESGKSGKFAQFKMISKKFFL